MTKSWHKNKILETCNKKLKKYNEKFSVMRQYI